LRTHKVIASCVVRALDLKYVILIFATGIKTISWNLNKLLTRAETDFLEELSQH
jgi:hypothetical protein